MSQKDISIVIPCYNEEKNIPILLERFDNVFKMKPDLDIELILCNNGSTDNTGKVIDAEIAMNHYSFIRKINLTENKGYGFGILAGLKEAKGLLLAYTHADLQTDPEDVIRAYELYRIKSRIEKMVIVKGRRCQRKLNESLLSLGMRVLTTIIAGVSLSDINAQPKIFSSSLLSLLKEPPSSFAFDLYLLSIAKKHSYKIYDFPVRLKKRLYEEAKGGSGSKFKTKWNIICDYIRYFFILRKILKVHY
jgi:glycosyltransferase involved in cell wall biosynthesis